MERFESLKERANDLSDAEFELAIAEISALADNGHTGVLVGRWAVAFNRLGVRFLLADDGLFVADAIPEYEDLVGSRVVTLAGRDLDELREEWARYFAGRVGRRDDAMYAFIESPELLHAAGLSSSPESTALVLEGGRTVEVGITEAWPEPQGLWQWIPQARQIELAEAGRVAGNPLYLQEPEIMFRYGELPVDGAAYVQFRANHLFDGGNLKAQSAVALKALRERAPRAIVVDQRFNFGGNLNDTRDFMQAIPEVVGPEGHVFVIISGRTFSAGIASVGYLKQAGGDRVTIIGAPVGDRLEFWAEGSPIRLPDSSTLIGVATERHNYQTGCPEDDCHGSIRRNPIAVASLEPDVRPEVSYTDVVEGRDPNMEAALEMVANSSDDVGASRTP